jgi:hypothetical protein
MSAHPDPMRTTSCDGSSTASSPRAPAPRVIAAPGRPSSCDSEQPVAGMARSSVVTRACGKRVRFLIDTHVWLWAISANQRLRREAREVVEDPDNEVLLSVASAWEIGIKGAKGQLDLPAPAEVFVPEAIATSPTRFPRSRCGMCCDPPPCGHTTATRSIACSSHRLRSSSCLCSPPTSPSTSTRSV